MAIKLKVEDYCQQCLDFTPELIKPQRVMLDNCEAAISDAIVYCQYSKRCYGLVRHLRNAAVDKEEACG